MKKLLAAFLLVCIFLTPALTSSAAAHNYDYVYTDVNVITPDSFEDVFSDIKIDRAAFTYEMAVLNSAKAAVAMEFEIKVGFEYYTAIVSGVVPAIPLPSGEVLYEGPISGNMTVGEDEYRATVGFIKLAGADGVMVSVTLQSDSALVAFSFGENIIQGEVLELFTEMASSAQSANNSADDLENGTLEMDGFANSEGETASVLAKAFDQIIFDGGGGGGTTPNPNPNLGENGEYVFQNAATSRFTENGDLSLKSKVYWYQNFNIMAVTMHPYSQNAQLHANRLYINTYGFDTVSAFLDSFQIKLSLKNTGITEAQHGRISSIILSQEASSNNFSKSITYFPALLKDLLAIIGIKTNTLSVAVDDILGSTSGYNNDYYGEINVDMSLYASLLDEINSGVPFYFNLYRPIPETYEGNTPYTVTVTVNYQYLAALYGDSALPSYSIFYGTYVNVHEGYLDLNPI